MGGRRNGAARQRQVALLAERQVQIWQAYKSGKSMAEIAEEFHLSYSTIGSDIKKYLAELRQHGLESVGEYRQAQLERIREAIKAIWPNVEKGRTEAVNTLIRLLERESRLLGLDAPAKVNISAKIEAIATELGVNPEEAHDVAEGFYRELQEGTTE